MWTSPLGDSVRTGLCALALLASTAGAQGAAVGRLEGTISTRVRSGSVRAASVEAVRLDPEPSVSFKASADDRGRFHIDSVPAGRYMIQLASAMLDSLGLSMLSSEMRVMEGQTVKADFSLPAGAALRDAMCRGTSLGSGMAVVAGRGIDADTDEPLRHAKVVVAWHEMTVDKATLQPTRVERGIIAETGLLGEYRLCGVPAGSWLTIQLQNAERASGVARVLVAEDEGAVIRDLSMSVRNAPLISTLDSLERLEDSVFSIRADEGPAADAAGTAIVTGTVRGAGGQPLDGVEVRLANVREFATTDAAGRYTLRNLSPGTQLLYVRRIGFGVVETGIELRAGHSLTRDIRLDHITSLDSIRIIAERSRYAEFESNRRSNLFGRFLTTDDIARRHPVEVSELFPRMGGFTVTGEGPEAMVVSSALKEAHPSCKQANVVIDGIPRAGVNYLPVSQVAAIEAYRDGTTAPAPYRNECGVIIIWTKKYRPALKVN